MPEGPRRRLPQARMLARRLELLCEDLDEAEAATVRAAAEALLRASGRPEEPLPPLPVVRRHVVTTFSCPACGAVLRQE